MSARLNCAHEAALANTKTAAGALTAAVRHVESGTGCASLEVASALIHAATALGLLEVGGDVVGNPLRGELAARLRFLLDRLEPNTDATQQASLPPCIR
jgi:hypothetical protein